MMIPENTEIVESEDEWLLYCASCDGDAKLCAIVSKDLPDSKKLIEAINIGLRVKFRLTPSHKQLN